MPSYRPRQKQEKRDTFSSEGAGSGEEQHTSNVDNFCWRVPPVTREPDCTRPVLLPLLVMTADKTVHGASGRHRLAPMLGACPHESGGAPACAVVASRFLQRHDGPCAVCWRVGRVALGSGGPCLGPRGMLGIRARPPLLEPTVRAGQLPTAVLDLVASTRGVQGLGTAVFCVLGHEGGLGELRGDVPLDPVFSLVWHK